MACNIRGREETFVFPDWVILARVGRTDCHDNHAAASEAVSNDTTAVPVVTASGQSGYLSFTLSAPPEASYLNLHLPNNPAKSVSVLSSLPAYPRVMAADKNIVLLNIAIPIPPHCVSVTSDLFVYTFTLGILRLAGDDDRYIISDIIFPAKNKFSRRVVNNGKKRTLFAKLIFYSSERGEWVTIPKSAPLLHGQSNGQFPNHWSTDDVIPFGGRFLCWIDYFSGVLLADFSKIDSSELHFVPFPGGKEYSDDVRLARICPWKFQRVSISKDAMRFVYIDNDWHPIYRWDYNDEPIKKSSQGPPRGSKVTIWTLMNNMADGGDFKFQWEVHRVINLDCLWAQCSYQDEHLPQCLPEYPFLAVDDPDVLCCLVREEDESYKKARMIMVDMKSAYMLSCKQWTDDVAIIPTVFSRGLKMPAGIPCDKDKLVTRLSKKAKLLT